MIVWFWLFVGVVLVCSSVVESLVVMISVMLVIV